MLVTGLATLALLAVMAAQASASCRTVGARAKVESSAFATDLAYMYVSKRFCFNGRRTGGVSRPDITPVITRNGDYSGWEWKGVDYVRHRYYTKDGRRKGGHFTWVIGKFRQELWSYKHAVHVWVKLWGYYNGGARTDRKNSR